ncbi:TetR/AcrR family transcriptional regulator [Demequina silvatica]|uniref:TetR/AcrR family transcriptional regulator n=1 Tax=Demequina silvatica TaxID=1638988 RepID=UPI000781DF51|nr:TetR family transcriptional regulator C-terminal domain-containing protein [Demequina silvatica]
MPKIVDHDQRRREILEAAWRVIAEQGIGAATVREIANEAGCSNGILSHYFASKDEILISAHKLAFHRVSERAAAANNGTNGAGALRQALYEALPLDKERHIEAVMDVSFWSQALANPRLNAVRRESVAESRLWWLAMLEDARSAGELTADVPDGVLCDEIMALIDGVSVQAVMYPEDMTPERQRTIADGFLAHLGI